MHNVRLDPYLPDSRKTSVIESLVSDLFAYEIENIHLVCFSSELYTLNESARYAVILVFLEFCSTSAKAKNNC